jgi:hypothetical protein
LLVQHSPPRSHSWRHRRRACRRWEDHEQSSQQLSQSGSSVGSAAGSSEKKQKKIGRRESGSDGTWRAHRHHLYMCDRQQCDDSLPKEKMPLCFNHPRNSDTGSRSQKVGRFKNFVVHSVLKKEPRFDEPKLIYLIGTVICPKRKKKYWRDRPIVLSTTMPE